MNQQHYQNYQPEQLNHYGVTPEIYEVGEHRINTFMPLADKTVIAFKAMKDFIDRQTDRSIYSQRLVASTILPRQIEVPAGVDGKLVGISDQAEWLKNIREDIRQLHATSAQDQTRIAEHNIAPVVRLDDYRMQYEGMDEYMEKTA